MNIEPNIEKEYIARLINHPERAFTTPLSPDDFGIMPYGAAFMEMRRQIKDGVAPTFISVAMGLPKYTADLAAINTVAKDNYDYYEQQMIEHVERRRALISAKTITDGIEAGEDMSSIFKKMSDLLLGCRVSDSGSSRMTLYQCAMEYGPVLEARFKAKGKLPGITTGLPFLDKVLGGFQPAIYFIGARPSDGKTAMLLSMMRSALKAGHKTAMISLESSQFAIIARVLSSEGPISMNRIKSGNLLPKDANSLTDTMERLKGWEGYIEFDPRSKLQDIERTCTALVKGAGVEILFIDYLQRIQAPGNTKIEQVGAASRALTDISRTLNVPVVCLAQTGRQADHEGPQMSHFQHSSQIEQDADVAMIINHRDREPENPDTGRDSFLTVLKNRDGEVGDIPLHFDRDTVRFLPKEL